jgi:hypothetical protein
MFLMDFFGYYPLLPRLSDQAAIHLHQDPVNSSDEIMRAAIYLTSNMLRATRFFRRS